LKKSEFRYQVILASQSPTHKVFVFTARAKDILSFATIDQAARDERGHMRGFQRPQIASHISHIRDYLDTPNAILPNAIVVAFVDGVRIQEKVGGGGQVEISVKAKIPGFVVDGQQRLTALSQLQRDDFDVFVIGLICADVNELRKQFILVNSTRPLPKSLIYELLPEVNGMPANLSARTEAARLIEALNFESDSSLTGAIKTHTNPSGVITDSALYRVIMNSAADGAIRELASSANPRAPFELVSNFYGAVAAVFKDAWKDHTPKTSRLIHGTGIAAMGYVMETIYRKTGKYDQATFVKALQPLAGKTAWTSGVWRFGKNETVPWDRLQNVNRDVVTLTHHLIGQLRPVKTTKKRRTKRSRRA
jgi:DGQHR domain-containing protein